MDNLFLFFVVVWSPEYTRDIPVAIILSDFCRKRNVEIKKISDEIEVCSYT